MLVKIEINGKKVIFNADLSGGVTETITLTLCGDVSKTEHSMIGGITLRELSNGGMQPLYNIDGNRAGLIKMERG